MQDELDNRLEQRETIIDDMREKILSKVWEENREQFKEDLNRLLTGDFFLPEMSEEEIKKAEENYKKELEENPNNFSKWWAVIKDVKSDVVLLPKTLVFDVPMNILKCCYGDNPGPDRLAVTNFIAEKVWSTVNETFPDAQKLFIKNATFSDKFDFSESCLVEYPSIASLADHLMNINYQSACVEAGGGLELVVREYIESTEFCDTIYDGMPLRPEMRAFVDFSEEKPRWCYDVFYWDYDTVRDKLWNENDQVVFDKCYHKIYTMYMWRRGRFYQPILDFLSQCKGFNGIWSVDFILEQDKCWLIDMATGPSSAYWDSEKAKKK